MLEKERGGSITRVTNTKADARTRATRLALFLLILNLVAICTSILRVEAVGSIGLNGFNVMYGGGQGFEYHDLVKIKSLGFNTVRYWIYWSALMPNGPYTVNTRVFTQEIGGGVGTPHNTHSLDQYVDWAGQLGLKAILCLAWSNGILGCKPSEHIPTWCGWGGFEGMSLQARCQRLFTVGRAERTGWLNAWKAIAQRYGNRNHVIFEFINEPSIYNEKSSYPEYYAKFCEEWVDIVLARETVRHTKLVPLLMNGKWVEIVDQQRDVNRDVGWVTHHYMPWGNYYPSATTWCYDYVSKKWGNFPHDKYVYWRIRRCADKIHSWGKQWYVTEFAKAPKYTYWNYWLKLVLGCFSQLGAVAWMYHDYDVADCGGWSVVDKYGNVRTKILNALYPSS